MVKSGLAYKLSKKFPELKASYVELALDCILGQMVDALVQEGRIEIRGLAVLVVGIGHPDLPETPKRGNLSDSMLKWPYISSPAKK